MFARAARRGPRLKSPIPCRCTLGGAAELFVYACDVAVALILYDLLKPVSRSLALLAAFFRLAYAAIAGAHVLNHFAPLLLVSGAEYPAAFSRDQMRELAATFIRLHAIGFDIALAFFGFHLCRGWLPPAQVLVLPSYF